MSFLEGDIFEKKGAEIDIQCFHEELPCSNIFPAIFHIVCETQEDYERELSILFIVFSMMLQRLVSVVVGESMVFRLDSAGQMVSSLNFSTNMPASYRLLLARVDP